MSECFLRYDNLSDAEKKEEELICDKFAQSEYDSIKARINRWVVDQSWYKP